MAVEVIYFRNLLENIKFPQAPDTPVHEDNTVCIERGTQNRMMRLMKIDTKNRLADIFTKALANP